MVVAPVVGFATDVRLCLLGSNLRLVNKVGVQTRTVIVIETALVILLRPYVSITKSIIRKRVDDHACANIFHLCE